MPSDASPRLRAAWLTALIGAGPVAAMAAAPLHSCPSGKRGYASKRQAKLATRNVRNRIRAYLCPDCHAWHVTRSE